MLKNLANKMLKGTVFALVGAFGSALIFTADNFNPTNLNTLEQWLWSSVIASGLAGAGAAIHRYVNWNPSLVK